MEFSPNVLFTTKSEFKFKIQKKMFQLILIIISILIIVGLVLFSMSKNSTIDNSVILKEQPADQSAITSSLQKRTQTKEEKVHEKHFFNPEPDPPHISEVVPMEKNSSDLIFHLYTFCCDEENIVPFFLQHYHWVQKITIWFDDSSSDNSEELLRKDPRVEIVPFHAKDGIGI